jgi:hypothetical protein
MESAVHVILCTLLLRETKFVQILSLKPGLWGLILLDLQVETPKEEPKLPVSFWGFTENADVWNSRASMIGIFGIIIVEAVSFSDHCLLA